MARWTKAVVGFGVVTCLFGMARGAAGRFSGQGYGWGSLQADGSTSWVTKLGYLPQYYREWEHGQDRGIALEVALHGYWQYRQEKVHSKLELYRGNWRFNTPRLELVLGRQQINFGPALLLRSLRWFDALDPRDPLKIVSGVDGGRIRYTFSNNSNLWGWVLYGKAQRKGYELLPTDDYEPETGGRWQWPSAGGELAVTGHTRQVRSLNAAEGREYRLALDGRWDIGPGIWFESVGQYTTRAVILTTYQRSFMTTIGLDYTVGIGNGLYIALEHWYSCWQGNRLLPALVRPMTACLLTYPFSLFDNLSAIAFYDWKERDFYPFVTWQRTYDKVVINLSLYHYPAANYAMGDWLTAGTGLQCMLIYNH